jgi:hypothetical protein
MNIRTLFMVIYVLLPAFCLSVDGPTIVTIVDQFRYGLYNVQKGFLKKDKLDRLMEPYLQEMEDSLFLFTYFKHNAAIEPLERRGYLRDLFTCYVACFYDFIRNKDSTRHGTDLHARWLQYRIVELEKRGILQGCTWQEEYRKTIDILHRMAVAYYKALPRRKKFKIWWLKRTTLIEFRGLSFIPGNEFWEPGIW